jgi:hypothetical protein
MIESSTTEKGANQMHNYKVTYHNPATDKDVIKTYNNISEETLKNYIARYTSFSKFTFVSSEIV